MKKLLITFSLMLITQITMGQTTFTTNRANAGMVVKMNIEWTLNEDNTLTMEYLDKNTIKQMEKMGQPTTMVMPYKLEKTQDLPTSEQYMYQDDSLQITVITKNPSGPPSVIMKTRDTFTGTSAVQTYFNM